ncbi:MAG TPA: hypothetical protein VND93_06365 [Myxococcales bacterium]|jgi:hypothetical protein|nr:hypothetical protein [Myxococcales bacterium]
MKLPDLFRREKKGAGAGTAIAAQDRAERLLVESFRLLSRLCTSVADLIETQRLERRGYQPQGKWLERMDPPPTSPDPPNKSSIPGR